MSDEVKKLLERITEERTVPFEPPLNKTALMKTRSQVSARIKFYKDMTAQGFPVSGGVESGAALVRAIDNYLWVATRPSHPDPEPDEWWQSVLDDATNRSEE